jgi:hypothetical protein
MSFQHLVIRQLHLVQSSHCSRYYHRQWRSLLKVAENISSFICNSAIVYIYSIKSTRNLNPSQRTEKMSGRTRTWREIRRRRVGMTPQPLGIASRRRRQQGGISKGARQRDGIVLGSVLANRFFSGSLELSRKLFTLS